MKSGLTAMAELHNTPLFAHKDKLEHTLRVAITSIGPRMMLDAVPLMIDGTEYEMFWFIAL